MDLEWDCLHWWEMENELYSSWCPIKASRLVFKRVGFWQLPFKKLVNDETEGVLQSIISLTIGQLFKTAYV